jgi:probable HAF family extracellular repeat protein
MRRRLTISAFLILALVAQSVGFTRTTQAAAPIYTVVDLGTLGGSVAYAMAINNRGHVIGGSSLPEDPTDPTGELRVHTFLYRGGQMIDLGTLGGDSSYPEDLNDMDQVVGSSFLTGNPIDPQFAPLPAIHGFLYSNGAMMDLGTLGGPSDGLLSSAATGISDSGRVAGTSNVPGGDGHGFIYINGVMQEVPMPAGDTCAFSGMNNSNLAVGQYSTAGSALVAEAFTYDTDQTKTFLGTLGGDTSFATSANDTGWVVGSSFLSGSPQVFHAFLYKDKDSGMIDLGTLPGDTSSEASDINAAGQVVGTSSQDNLGIQRGFLYSGGVMYDLNSLIPADSGWQIISAGSINDLGQIVGFGLHNGQPHAFLLSIPERSIDKILSLLQGFNLPQGINNALTVKLQHAIEKANAGDIGAACSLLNSFINQVNAQPGNALTPEQAGQLIDAANQTRTEIGCR